MKNIKTILFSVILSGVLQTTQAQVVTPDLSFGSNGSVITDFFTKDDAAQKILRQTNGKYIVAGTSIENSHKTFMLARYNANGSTDSTFGISGKINAWYVSANNVTTSAALQSDGKIVLAGYFDNNFYNDPAIVRFNSNGAPDNTFGTGGFATFFLSNQFDEFHDIAVQSDGKIVATGRTFENNTYNFLTVRLLPNGVLDPSFGTNGKVTTDINGGYDCAYSLIIQPDNKILVSGNTEPGSSYFAAARYMPDGSPDLTFGVAGKATIASGSRFDKAYGMALQSDSSIVLAGTHHNSSTDEYMVVRLNKFGIPDNSFGTNGIVYLPTSDPTDAAKDVTIQQDGKIIIAANGNGNKALLIRLLSDGTPDATFGSQGYYAGNITGSNSALNSVIILPDHSVVACGSVKPGNNDDFLLTKILVNNPTGIETISSTKSDIRIFPNPATGYINVHFYDVVDHPGTLTIYNENGKLIMTQRFGFLYPPFKIELPQNLPAGFYYLDIRSREYSSGGKFLVK